MISAITAVILAGGASKRMGQTKQLLQFNGNTLIGHVCERAIASKADDVVVVLGAESERIEKSIADYPLGIVSNQLWHEGIASSIKSAVRHILSRPECVDGLLFLTCDQVAISTDLLNSMIDSFNDSFQSIVACSYGNTYGIPALFPRRYFGELLLLSGDRGAQQLLNVHRKKILPIPFPGGEIDIDTRRDYQSLLAPSTQEHKQSDIITRTMRPAVFGVAKECSDETT